MAKCKECGEELIIGTNWTDARKRNYEYICKSCKSKKNYEYWKRNRSEHLKYHRNKQSEYKQTIRSKVKSMLGNKCIICGVEGDKNIKIVAHEIYGKPHNNRYSSYIIEHIEDFVPLCRFCHRHVHWCMKYLGFTWKCLIAEIRVREFLNKGDET